MSSKDKLARLDLVTVLRHEIFHLVRRGQKYGILWDESFRDSLMIRDIGSHVGGRVHNAEEVEPYLFRVDGELKAGIRKEQERPEATSGPFFAFLCEVLTYLEDQQ